MKFKNLEKGMLIQIVTWDDYTRRRKIEYAIVHSAEYRKHKRHKYPGRDMIVLQDDGDVVLRHFIRPHMHKGIKPIHNDKIEDTIFRLWFFKEI